LDEAALCVCGDVKESELCLRRSKRGWSNRGRVAADVSAVCELREAAAERAAERIAQWSSFSAEGRA
jgi:hypothetical protein